MIELRYFIEPQYPMLPRLQWRRRVWWMLWAWSEWAYVPTIEHVYDGTFRPSMRFRA